MQPSCWIWATRRRKSPSAWCEAVLFARRSHSCSDICWVCLLSSHTVGQATERSLTCHVVRSTQCIRSVLYVGCARKPRASRLERLQTHLSQRGSLQPSAAAWNPQQRADVVEGESVASRAEARKILIALQSRCFPPTGCLIENAASVCQHASESGLGSTGSTLPPMRSRFGKLDGTVWNKFTGSEARAQRNPLRRRFEMKRLRRLTEWLFIFVPQRQKAFALCFGLKSQSVAPLFGIRLHFQSAPDFIKRDIQLHNKASPHSRSAQSKAINR